MAVSWNADERRGGRADTLFAKMGLDGDGLSDTASSMTVQEHSYLSEGDSYSLMGLCKEINRSAEWSRLHAEKRAYLKQIAQAKAAQISGMDMVPSGKRQQGEGCEDDDQGIVQASETSDGCVVLRITLLAAGFIIGPGGQTVRDISDVSVCKIQSWTETVTHYGNTRRVRKLVLDGKPRNVAHAVYVIKAAVARYKELCEGNYCNQLVDPVQPIMGVEFIYQPPPRKAVPHAAGITTKPPKQRSSRRNKENISENPSMGLLKCLVDGAPVSVSSQPKQSDFHSWSSAVLGNEKQGHLSNGAWKEFESSDDILDSSGMFSNDSLGMSEVPCCNTMPALYGKEHTSHSGSQVSAHAGYHLFADNAGQDHLKSYPWAHVDMLRNTNVESLLSHPSNAKEGYYQGPSSLHLPSYRDRLVSSSPPPPVYQRTSRRRKDASEPKLPENYLEHMFALFDEKCQVADDDGPRGHLFGKVTPLKIPPKSGRVKHEATSDTVKRRIPF